VAIAIHWLIALLIFLNVGVGIFMESFPKSAPGHDVVLFYHASIGSLIFMLAVLRLLWRITHKPPALPASISSWQQTVAHALHWILYSLMFLVPLELPEFSGQVLVSTRSAEGSGYVPRQAPK